MFFVDLMKFQKLMVGETNAERLLSRSAMAAMAKHYLTWAMKPPENEPETEEEEEG